jgi:hypothetical protein
MGRFFDGHKKAALIAPLHLRGFTSGCHVRCGRLARCAGRSCHDRDDRYPNRRDGGHPNARDRCHASDDFRNNVEPVDSNAAPIGNNAVAGSTAGLAGSNVAARNTCCHPDNRCRLCCSRPVRVTCRPLNCNTSPRRSTGRNRQRRTSTQQAEEFVYTWRPPGPRVGHTSDAGRRQSFNR